MRYLLVTGIYPPEIGGPATVMSEIAEQLRGHKKKLHIITYSALPSEPGVTRVSPKGNVFCRYIRFYHELKREIKSDDIICATDAFSVGIPTRFALLGRKNQFILRLGGEWIWERMVERQKTRLPLMDFWKREQGSFRFFLFAAYYGWLFHRVTRLVLVSKWLVTLFEVVCPGIQKKAEILGYGSLTEITSKPKRLPKRPKTLRLIFVGRFVHVKNLSFLSKIFSLAHGRAPGLSIEFIGDGEQLPAIKEQLKPFSTATFLGELSHRQTMERLSASDLLVLPSISDICPNVVMESLAMGIPCLITSHHGLPRPLSGVVEEDPTDSAAWVNRLVELAQQEDAYKTLSQSVRPVPSSQKRSLLQILLTA